MLPLVESHRQLCLSMFWNYLNSQIGHRKYITDHQVGCDFPLSCRQSITFAEMRGMHGMVQRLCHKQKMGVFVVGRGKGMLCSAELGYRLLCQARLLFGNNGVGTRGGGEVANIVKAKRHLWFPTFILQPSPSALVITQRLLRQLSTPSEGEGCQTPATITTPNRREVRPK